MFTRTKPALALAAAAALSISSALLAGGVTIPASIVPGQTTVSLTRSASGVPASLVANSLRDSRCLDLRKPGQHRQPGMLIPTTWGDVFHPIPTDYKLVVIPAETPSPNPQTSATAQPGR